MEKKIIVPFSQQDNKEEVNKKIYFFFLEHILKARIELKLESGRNEEDEELNIYLAGLLHSLICSDLFSLQKPYISPFDCDVQEWITSHPGLRTQYTVYRENADFGLICCSFFCGYHHQGSYYHHVFIETNPLSRIALYYEIASSLLSHLQGSHVSLVSVLKALSQHLDEIIKIVRYAASEYFDMMERISEGSFYHLEKEIERMEIEKKYEATLDEFLKIYSSYKDNPSEELKRKLFSLAQELKRMKKSFSFDESKI
ncbi:MAG: hypothetical protein N2053_08965 [Chitinispirillaceae bacterium]|nr:hypothetical protein [Chitinispirillaceae bacterium]